MKLPKNYFLIIGILVLLLLLYQSQTHKPINSEQKKLKKTFTNDFSQLTFIFIGGYSKTGKELIKSILGVHPDINCQTEPKFLSIFFNFMRQFKNQNQNLADILNSGLKNNTLDSATSLFVRHLIKNNIGDKKYVCLTDSDMLKDFAYMKSVFKNSKFLYMKLDYKSIAYTLVEQLETERTFEKFRNYFMDWHYSNLYLNKECENLSKDDCKAIEYEDLILFAPDTLRNVTGFLNLTWMDGFVDYSKFDKYNAISLSKEIRKPVDHVKIRTWAHGLKFTKRELEKINLELVKFGIDLNDNS